MAARLMWSIFVCDTLCTHHLNSIKALYISVLSSCFKSCNCWYPEGIELIDFCYMRRRQGGLNNLHNLRVSWNLVCKPPVDWLHKSSIRLRRARTLVLEGTFFSTWIYFNCYFDLVADRGQDAAVWARSFNILISLGLWGMTKGHDDN